MAIVVEETTVERIASWRDLYRQEMNCQIIHDSLHARPGWTRTYLWLLDGMMVGYGSIAVAGPWQDQPSIFEIYVQPQYRERLFGLFVALVQSTGVTRVETQTNDVVLSTLLHALSPSVRSESILFHDRRTSSLIIPNVTARRATAADSAATLAADLDPEAQYVLVERDAIVGTGGILFHYNRPYGDIFMKIAEPARAAAGWAHSSCRS